GTVDIGAFEAQPYATTTSLQSSVNPSNLGRSVTFTATVVALKDGVNGSPTGTVNFFDDSTLLGSGTLSNGIATFTTTGLTTGNHSITAVYVGTARFLTSSSNGVTQFVKVPSVPPPPPSVATVPPPCVAVAFTTDGQQVTLLVSSKGVLTEFIGS